MDKHFALWPLMLNRASNPWHLKWWRKLAYDNLHFVVIMLALYSVFGYILAVTTTADDLSTPFPDNGTKPTKMPTNQNWWCRVAVDTVTAKSRGVAKKLGLVAAAEYNLSFFSFLYDFGARFWPIITHTSKAYHRSRIRHWAFSVIYAYEPHLSSGVMH